MSAVMPGAEVVLVMMLFQLLLHFLKDSTDIVLIGGQPIGS
jgi:hypothetical protein